LLVDGNLSSLERASEMNAEEDIDHATLGAFIEVDIAFSPNFIMRVSETAGYIAHSDLEIRPYAYQASLGHKPYFKTEVNLQYEIEDNWFLTVNAFYQQYAYKASKATYIPEIDTTISHPKSTSRFYGALIGVDYVLE
jgi:hypothetical protein